MKSILILGDGNFSFTLSLHNLIRQSLSQYHITATSYDSRDAILAKYHESYRILNILDSYKDGLVICHGVDATQSLALQLQTNRTKFDEIIFNFPHLGVENCLLHSYLLGHTLHWYIIQLFHFLNLL
jgi:hypothetical protein